MRLTQIEFRGFKRLVSTRCNVDGKLIAFLGPNEAGKSSVLEGLDWLTNLSSDPLPGYLRSRGGRIDDATEIVRATFVLDVGDLSVLNDVGGDGLPSHFILAKTAGGELRHGVDPWVNRPVAPFDEAVAALTALQFPSGSEFTDFRELLKSAVIALSGASTGTFSEEQVSEMTQLTDLLRDPPVANAQDETEDESGPMADPFPANMAVADTVASAIQAGASDHPNTVTRNRLRPLAPAFLLFGETDRILQSTYNLGDDSLRASPAPALRNLLALAGVTVADLWTLVEGADMTALRTLLRRINERLEARLRPTWRQAEVTVYLNIDGTILQVFIDELDEHGSTVAIHERSDGLKAFVALVCFLETHGASDPAPILLIDEAETHLHYDAQADLIDVLQDHVKAAKVLYTTHSPGCLPPDMGTGVRLVSPDPRQRDVSTLRNDFWSSNEPGFSSLLFAMGAGAAAFSACRRAVMGEGPTEMILLPTLIRVANDLATLPYQVAPGLSVLRRGEYGAEVAAQLAYLVDGDDGGQALRSQLIAAGVVPDAIASLPTGQAIEDLLEPQSYVNAVNALLKDAGNSADLLSLEDLGDEKPISRVATAWCGAHNLKTPSKPAVANYLVQDPTTRVALTDEGQTALRQLHTQFVTRLGC